MYANTDHLLKFITIKIEFADLDAKNDFKRLTNTDPIHNPALDFEFIFPMPPNLPLNERCSWRYHVWGSDAMDCEGEIMKESGNLLTYEFTTKVGIPIAFVKNLYLYSRVRKVHVYCLDGCDLVYANSNRTAPCIKRNCDHDWCDMVFQEWEVKYDWSELPHPLLEVSGTLNWIRENFNPCDDRETGLIYHQMLHELARFKKLADSDLVAEAKNEFERQIDLSGNAYLRTMLVLNDYERSPEYAFKNGLNLIYKNAIDYYLKNTQPVREVPRFPKRKKRSRPQAS